jgi:hypothetical protein
METQTPEQALRLPAYNLFRNPVLQICSCNRRSVYRTLACLTTNVVVHLLSREVRLPAVVVACGLPNKATSTYPVKRA